MVYTGGNQRVEKEKWVRLQERVGRRCVGCAEVFARGTPAVVDLFLCDGFLSDDSIGVRRKDEFE